MYLKTIKAKGFKSFADQTELDFTNEINGIVGPNGSGKSNVVDAIRWVLGEQSVKSLRGESTMTDVIFSGSKSRQPMNMASVSLIFDNKDNYFPISYDEIEIKRRVYKDGTNEYFLNGEKVRLKDITNLLLDSGIAKESFNIISQGQIEEIISSKPENRRIIFEEASGVLKYKRRKEEAIRKLEKTHNNIDRISDIISELSERIEPLKMEREKALEYKDASSNLESLDIALITEDITKINFEYQEAKDKLESLNKEIIEMMTTSSSNEAEIEKYKNQILKIDNEIRIKQEEILKTTALAENLNARKQIINERKKYEVDNAKLHDTVVELKEKQLTTENEINSLKNEIDYLKKDLTEINEKIKQEENKLKIQQEEKLKIQKSLTNTIRQTNNEEIKIENLRESIERGGNLPTPVRSVLSNPKLRGIHNTIGNIIEVDEAYSLAITTALGYMVNNIIVDDENSAKEAIKYLKTIGRATFFPLNVIKPKKIEDEVLRQITNIKGYISVASSLVNYDKTYENIVKNQLGNIIVTDNIDTANLISKKINNRYRIVTLDGEIIHVGGSITGGKQNTQRNVISDKYELENSLKIKDKLLEETKELENKINEHDYTLKNEEDKIYIITKEKMLKEELIKNKESQKNKKQLQYQSITNDINSTNNMLKGTISSEEEEIIEKYYSALKEKDEKTKELQSLLKEKDNLNNSLEEYEITYKKNGNLYNSKANEIKEIEILVNRQDVKLDNLLNTLNENYSMTYEKAKENYKLEIDYNKAKNEVNKLKKKLKELGDVNLTAPEEYETVSTRYEFLMKQINDLNEAENTLLSIISEMDKVMIKEFEESFKTINEHFKETFRELFGGGKAELKLTDPNNILETGVEIIASPPGKKLSSISLLSGGEKTLTAISLLFAIIKSKPSPFCVLDEVEAALDEANVEIFGNYLLKLKEKSEFIIITHKKKTMEFADILYGITMQESGVSKLVSVKLEEIS
ncbi:MAG: AAA family ATPase [Bacilli bacterium]|nr:AAA family ATPase [Bacilli bacterium]